MAATLPATRRYDLLFAAMNQLLAVLADDGDERAALERSFEATADGFGARNALLLLVEGAAPLALTCVHSRPVPVARSELLGVSNPLHEAAAQYALALDFVARNEPQSADAAFRRALALWPEHADAQYDHARLLARTGDWRQAADAFRRLVELSPHFTQGRVELGQVLMELGQADEAMEVFEAALADEPENPIALTSLGIVLREADRLTEAAAILQRALGVAVPLEEAYQTLTGVLVDQGDFGGAEEVLVRGEGSITDPKKRARLQLSLACLMGQQGRAEEAIAWLRRACSTDPENPALKVALAQALEEAKPAQ